MSRYRPDGWTAEYLPAEARCEILRDVGRERSLKVLIETGTHRGKTPMALRDDFTELHTIELGDDWFESAVDLFRPYPQVHCWHGDSTKVLPEVLAMVDQPALVWLDAHNSGPDTARGPVDSPIRAELAVLFADRHRHVVLIDDARCFAEGSEHDLEPHYLCYPAISWVQAQAAANGYDFALEDDIMRLIPQ